MSHIYHIHDDASSATIEAESVAEALANFGYPESITSAKEFEAYLEKIGGFGSIREDDILIANVNP